MKGSICLLLAALAPAASCVAVRYQARQPVMGDPPVPPMRIETAVVRDLHAVPGEHQAPQGGWARPTVTRDGLQNQEASDDVERTVLWDMRIQAGARTKIAAMTWSPASAPRCAGGHPALDILVDDVEHNNWLAPDDVQVHWERPLVVSGEHVVAGRFDEDRPLLHAPSVVDVLLVHDQSGRATEECVRLVATGPGVTYWNQKRWSVGGRVSWRRSLPFTKSSTLGFALSLGRWTGPVRISIEVMAGGTEDGKPDPEAPGGTGWCFIAPGTDCDDATFGGAALETSGIAWRWHRWALGWSLAYESIFASIKHTPPASGALVKRSAFSGGPRLAAQVLRALPDIAGVSRHSPTSAWGFELFAAAGQTWRGDAAGSPVTFGVALLGF